MAIASFFWYHRLIISKITGVVVLIGLLGALLSRVEYEASATLLPESQTSPNIASNLLRQYGGLLGMDGGLEGSTTIPPSIYPDIVASLPYQLELMNTPLRFSEPDTTMTALVYFSDLYPPSGLDYLEMFTIGLPGQVMKLFRDDHPVSAESQLMTKIDRDTLISLTGEQKRAINELRDRIVIEQADNLVTLSAELPDPKAAAELGRAAVKLLKQYVSEYRTQKASEELQFVEEQVDSARQRFEKVQQQLAEFRDSNVNLATARARTRDQELQSKYDLAFSLYNTLAQNLEQAKLRVQKDTPVFTTVEPIIIPSGNSEPQTILIFVISIFTGLFLGLGYVILKDQWEEFQRYLSRHDRAPVETLSRKGQEAHREPSLKG